MSQQSQTPDETHIIMSVAVAISRGNSPAHDPFTPWPPHDVSAPPRWLRHVKEAKLVLAGLALREIV